MRILSGILDLLFPQKCTFCRKLLQKGEVGMCKACEAALPYTSGGGAQTGDFFEVCVSPLYYEDDVRNAILRFKFHEVTAYAGLFGKLIADCIQNELQDRYDLISWVPLSAKRLKKRGYDQAGLLAMSAALELGDVAVETLIKHTDVPAQSGMGSAEKRRANISGSYCAADPELIVGKRILLIDDIVTTGSTLAECSRVLLSAGADEVVCATLARVR